MNVEKKSGYDLSPHVTSQMYDLARVQTGDRQGDFGRTLAEDKTYTKSNAME